MPGGLHDGRWTRRRALVFDPVNFQRLRDIPECHPPHAFHRIGDAFLDLVEDLLGNANAARSRQWFDASSNVDAIANHVVITTDNVAQVNSDAHLEYPFRWIDRSSLYDRLLNLNPALHCRQSAGKFDQETVPDCLDFMALMFWKN